MFSIFLFVELFKNCALALVLVLVLVKAFLDMSQLQVFCTVAHKGHYIKKVIHILNTATYANKKGCCK